MCRMIFFMLKVFFLILCLFGIIQCAASPPTQFYLITPLAEVKSKTTTGSTPRPITVRVDAVQIPGYLDRAEIVTRVSENEIHLADLTQWGEPLRNNLTNVVAENLSRVLSPDCYFIYPFKCPSTVDYQISLEIVRMDGPLGGKVQIISRWSILRGEDNQIIASQKFRQTDEETASSYGALVASESRLVAALSLVIAENLPPCP